MYFASVIHQDNKSKEKELNLLQHWLRIYVIVIIMDDSGIKYFPA